MCYSLWYNAPTMLPATGRWSATSWVLYTTSCNTQSSAPEDGQNNCPKHVELTGIINKPLLLRLVGCLYYLYFIIFFLRLAKQYQFIHLQNVVYFITLTFWFVKYSHFTSMMCFYLNVQFQGQNVYFGVHDGIFAHGSDQRRSSFESEPKLALVY